MLYLLRPFPLSSWSADSLQRLDAFVARLAKVEPYFEGHIQRACFYGLNFGKWISLSEAELRRLYLATFFHDAGKVSIPPQILQKDGPLNPEEFKIMQAHPTLGEEICLKLGPLEEVSPIVAAHHEKLDGSGYPRGLQAKDIPMLARIMAIIEIYDALRSERVYKAPFSLEKSLEILRSEALAGHLDKGLVDEFAKFGESQYVDPDILAVDFFSQERSHAVSSVLATPVPVQTSPQAAAAVPEKAGITILVAEDNPDQMEIITTMLSKSRYRVVSAEDGQQAMERLEREAVDIALLDIMMPKMTGLEVCQNIRADPRLKNIYVIFLTALAGGEERVKGLEMGANDYVTKPFYLPELLARLSVGERVTRERQEMERQASYDPLTGLNNRRSFDERLPGEFERAKRYRRSLALLMLDVDNFKQVNDTYGHDWGDAVLKEVGRVLRERTRKSDIAARYGGEEFVVILPEIDAEGARQAAEKIRQEIKTVSFSPDSRPSFSVTVSVGVACTALRDYPDGQAAVKDADVALYQAKRSGKDRVECASGSSQP
jgi:diguanylate cyclase (GGDEF)-like protein